METINKTNTVAEIVTDNIKTTNIFKKHDIDFCCGGNTTLENTCEKTGLDFEHLKNELLSVDTPQHEKENYNNWTTTELIHHIIYKHHTYVLESIYVIKQYALKVVKAHGHRFTELLKINDLFNDISQELIDHLDKEEQILFPYIIKLERAFKNNSTITQPGFGTVSNPIKMLESEHENAGNYMKQIAKLSNNYQTPNLACNTFKALYAKLKEFEQDLHQHVHLENNILHIKAKELESKLF